PPASRGGRRLLPPVPLRLEPEGGAPHERAGEPGDDLLPPLRDRRGGDPALAAPHPAVAAAVAGDRTTRRRAAPRAPGARILLGDRPRSGPGRSRSPHRRKAPRPARVAFRPRPLGRRPAGTPAGGARAFRPPPLESRPCAGFPGS